MILLLWSWVVTADVSGEVWGGPLNLKQTVEFAVEHSPLVKSARCLQIADLQYKSQVSKMLPSLDITATHGLQNDTPVNPASGLFIHPIPQRRGVVY